MKVRGQFIFTAIICGLLAEVRLGTFAKSTDCDSIIATTVHLDGKVGLRPPAHLSDPEKIQYRLDHGLFDDERGIYEYAVELGKNFRAFYSGLKENMHWIDSGAGPDAKPQTEYLKGILKHARTTAIVYKGKDGSRKSDARVRFIEGKLELLSPLVTEPADLITDVYGPYSYSDRPDIVIRKYLEMLKVGGKAFIVDDMESKWRGPDGVPGDIRNFLKLCKGLEFDVRETNDSGGKWFMGRYRLIIEIARTSEEIYVPEVSAELKDDAPPVRDIRILQPLH